MFGSKLRSWMETHIVRPRKKGNKHKQPQDASTVGVGKTKAGTLPPNSNAIKCKSTTLPTSPVLTNSSGGSHSVIASPVRRREVSPIQCHTPSRYGWQSPDQDSAANSSVITSPKTDNFLYAPQPHRYQRQQQQQQFKQPQQLSVPTSKDSSSADKSPIKVNCSSSSISSLSWSTGSKEPSMHSSTASKYATFKVESASASAAVAVADVADEEEEVEYAEVGTLLLRPQPPQVHNFADYQRPHSENLSSFKYAEHSASRDESNQVRYGRLLPSKLVPASDSVESLSAVRSECFGLASNPSMNARLRVARAAAPRGNFMPGNRPAHSLSSPESAYSTGYSTDGTSPCAANYNPPEYYINMRTGTHYFPKSVNSLAIEAQRYKFGLNRIEEMSPLDPLPKSNFGNPNVNSFAQQPRLEPCTPAKLYESPSPRQRCRIRTNPWYNTGECAFGATAQQLTTVNPSPGAMAAYRQRVEVDATSTASSTNSSGIKSSNELEMLANKRTPIAQTTLAETALSKAYESLSEDGSASSSTEVENMHAPTVKRKHLLAASEQQAAGGKDSALYVASDEEATLNEMIGKFDESYVYEKETDILSSDSDPTDCCASEMDTGQDAGDECDTDELLDVDIDFIDTSSMQEVLLERPELQRNLGSCQYFTNGNSSPSRVHNPHKSSTRSARNSSNARDSQRRRKRFMKTRKKSCENREKVGANVNAVASPLQRPRESRSVGGTPVCLRRQLLAKERIYKTSPLSHRCNSLVFAGSTNESRFIGESEKAMLKADLEADMKYRQLIMEAESLLESMKNSLQSIPRDTPVASPRRLNPLANKRVEMLKNSEVESKKPAKEPAVDHDLAAAINKRIELLKFETATASASAPSSPKMGRCSPRKTHLTNFMNQNTPPELPPRKPLNNEPHCKAPLSPQLQLNGRRLGSPRTARRMESPSPSPRPRRAAPAIINLTGSDDSELEDRQQPNGQTSSSSSSYCPHSEPLKRKVYKGSSSFERIKKTFDLNLDMGQQNKMHVHGFTNEQRQTTQLVSVSAKSSLHDVRSNEAGQISIVAGNRKQQLLLNTIVDLKRSLEHQSYELNGLNGGE